MSFKLQLQIQNDAQNLTDFCERNFVRSQGQYDEDVVNVEFVDEVNEFIFDENENQNMLMCSDLCLCVCRVCNI